MELKDKIKALLGNGVSQSQVAMACGCDASYVTQLMSNEAFKAEVSELRVRRLTAATNRDEQLGRIEDKLLVKLNQAVDLMFKPSEIIQAFKTVNAAVRRGAEAPTEVANMRPVVPLRLPQVMIQNFVINGNSQVVEIDGRPMLTMPSKAALELVKQRQLATDVSELRELHHANN